MEGVACGAFFLLVIFVTVTPGSLAGDTIDRGLSVRDGDSLVSAGGSFELGFFSLGGSRKRYVGIWFKNIRVDNVVWVANGRTPLNDSTGVIKLGEDGTLVIQDKSGVTVWSSSSPAAAAADVRRNPEAQLLESGNLVIRDGDSNRSDASSYIWQSFDEPGDTLVAGMRLSVNTKTLVTRNLTSWRTADDPSPGNYTLRMFADKLPQAELLRGSTMVYSSGAWDGSRFSGIQDVMSYEAFRFDVVSDGDEVYYSFEVARGNYATLKLRPDGQIQRLVWNDRASRWNSFLSSSSDCDAFALCGPYGVCNISTSPTCQCPRGFRPRSPRDWYLGDGSGGCVRAAELRCGGGDGFLLLQQVKLPETGNATVDMSVGVEECQERCARDCACTAYARADLRPGKAGCVTWTGDLVDVRTFGLQQLYVKVPAAVLGDATLEDAVEDERKPSAAVVAASVAPVALLLVAACGGGMWMKKRSVTKREQTEDGDNRVHPSHVSAVGEAGDLPLLDFETIASATDNFSPGNKVGEGGFGVVYKGIFDDGQEVAVKRLSWTSVQGVKEFMNEATLIAKLQHKNLVRLLGCCIRGEERMLIYEYMQNKSLDSFIFDKSKHALLHWRTRLEIILGVARGLMYLHHDSRFKIIHRDLKASNILLDAAMNPKISDFGTARIFGADQNVEKTKIVWIHVPRIRNPWNHFCEI